MDQTGDLAIYQRDIINENEGLNLEYTGQVDYVHPFSKKVKMETGVKAVLRRIDSDYFTQVKETDESQYVTDTRLTDLFLYDQDVFAGYVSFNVSLGDKWGLVAGTRYEVTEIGGDFRSETPGFQNSYQNLLPSIILNRKLSQFSSIKASYNERIQRPSLFFINPFTAISDPNTLSIGNVGGSFEFSKKVRLDLFSFFRNRNQSLQGATASFSIISIGANWTVSKRTSLGIRVIEPWNENKDFISELSGPTFNQLSSFSIPFRSFGLNLSHKFRQIDFKSQNRRSRVKNDDQKSGDGGGDF